MSDFRIRMASCSQKICVLIIKYVFLMVTCRINLTLHINQYTSRCRIHVLLLFDNIRLDISVYFIIDPTENKPYYINSIRTHILCESELQRIPMFVTICNIHKYKPLEPTRIRIIFCQAYHNTTL